MVSGAECKRVKRHCHSCLLTSLITLVSLLYSAVTQLVLFVRRVQSRHFSPHPRVNSSAAALVLAPFNGVEVNTLLDQLPQRAQLAQECHSLLYCLEDVVNLCLSREAANTETDTAVRTLITVSEGSQYVARLQGSRCAGTARRQCNVLESHQQRLTLYVGKRNVDAAGVEGLRIAVLCSMLHGQETIQQPVGQVLDALRVVLCICLLARCFFHDAMQNNKAEVIHGNQVGATINKNGRVTGHSESHACRANHQEVTKQEKCEIKQ